MKEKSIKINKGFTLVETMFAIFILTATIVTLMTVVANSLFSARYAKDEITVNYLLQETIDYIRNDRDTAVFSGGTEEWQNFWTKYNQCFDSSRGCYFDVLSNLIITPTQCSLSGCPNLYYDENADETPFYVTNDGIKDVSTFKKTNFVRKVVITQNVTNPDEFDVLVTINWMNGSLPVSRSLKTSLLYWQQ
jgi:type II secretory pathway pseudopilin PulG